MQKNYIKELCKLKKVRQTELAMLLGMREDSFSIALKRNTLSIAKLEKIATALDVPMWQLFASPEEVTGSKEELTASISYRGEFFNTHSKEELKQYVSKL